MGRDGELTALDEAAITMHEMYVSFRRAGFTRSEATSIIAKVAAEAMDQRAGENGNEDD